MPRRKNLDEPKRRTGRKPKVEIDELAAKLGMERTRAGRYGVKKLGDMVGLRERLIIRAQVDVRSAEDQLAIKKARLERLLHEPPEDLGCSERMMELALKRRA